MSYDKVQIFRDGTLWHDAELYHVTRMGPRGGQDAVYEVWRDRDGKSVGQQFRYLDEIRGYVAESTRMGWSLIEEDEND